MVEVDASLGAEGPRDWVEVRLLGPLRVWRSDGTVVHDREWRTSKNADLLRWLALNAGEPIAVEALLAGLWPEVDDARARASLRTAVSHLRKVLGADAVVRGSSDVTLAEAWVDATAFVALAEEVRWRRRDGAAAEALAAAREADALYVADLPAGNSAPAPLVDRSVALSVTHRQLLEDAAELCIELGWMRDAVSYATRLLEADPVSELATRVLMLGHAGMGELHHALQAFERCRAVLAEELGVDPSQQTRAVHLQVLQAQPEPQEAPALVGRANELAWLGSVLEEATAGRGDSRRRIVLLAGQRGSGRRRLAAEACHRAGLKLYDVGARPELLEADAQGTVHLWAPDLSTDLGLLGRLLSDPAAVAGPDAVVIVVVPLPGVDHEWDRLHRGKGTACLELVPLLPTDVAELAEHLVGGRVTPELVEELVAESGGLPGRAAAVVRHWAGSGRLLATSGGLALAPTMAGGESDVSVRKALARAHPRLEGDALEALLLTSVMNRPVTPTLLSAVLTEGEESSRHRATAALEKLVDLGLLKMSLEGAVWRHPLMRDAAYGWMRPAIRRRVHLRVAQQAPIPSEQRIKHWLAGGERGLACLAALEAAEKASAHGDHAAARTYLNEVCSLGDLPESDVTDRVDLFERLGDACALVRRPDEARAAYSRALDVARGDSLVDTKRLVRKVEASENLLTFGQHGAHRLPGHSAATGSPVVESPVPDLALEASLREAVDRADREGDLELRLVARLHLAGDVYLPRRQFLDMNRRIGELLELQPCPEVKLRAAMAEHLPAVLLGGGGSDLLEALEEASATAEGAGEQEAWWRLLGMRVLVAHDLGSPDFQRLWPKLEERVETGPVDPVLPELATVGLRVMVERGLHDAAAGMAQHLSFAGGHRTTLFEHVSRLALAELAAATMEPLRASQILRSLVEEGTATGCTLLVPEAAARFVTLEADHDLAAAHSAFGIHREVAASGGARPREAVWGLLAKAALLAAQGNPRAAVGTCAEASTLAADHGLEFLRLRAGQQQALYAQASLPSQATAADRRTPVTRW